jgi:mannose-6-phosphate isomerase-like protein (cupin superfamily)
MVDLADLRENSGLNPGDIIALPAGKAHAFRNTGSGVLRLLGVCQSGTDRAPAGTCGLTHDTGE